MKSDGDGYGKINWWKKKMGIWGRVNKMNKAYLLFTK